MIEENIANIRSLIFQNKFIAFLLSVIGLSRNTILHIHYSQVRYYHNHKLTYINHAYFLNCETVLHRSVFQLQSLFTNYSTIKFFKAFL